jgi:hypothetical protein
MRTPDQIKTDATARFNPWTQANGEITRQDILDFLTQLTPELDKAVALAAFLDQLPFLRPGEKERILDTLDSYET